MKRYPECPEKIFPQRQQSSQQKKRERVPYTRGDEPKRERGRRYEDDWLDRLEAEADGEGINRISYPEETEFSPPARSPQEISSRRDKTSIAQSELEGHLYIPYYHLPPKGARFYDEIDTRSIAASTTATVIASITLDLSNAVLRWFSNELTNTTGYPNVSWTIFINGIAYEPWNGLTLSLGSINSPSLIFIPLILGDRFSVNATNNGSAAYTVRTRIKGWKW